MAGYDLSFEVPVRLHQEATSWLRFVQKLSKTRALEFRYKCTKKGARSTEFYVKVDGPLPEMQRLHRQLPEFFLPYVLTRKGKTSAAIKTISPFMVANEAGVGRITDMVFDVARKLSSTGPNTRASQLSLSPRSLDRAGLTRPVKPGDLVLKTLVRVMDLWSSRLLANEQAVITCDQAIENWIKERLALPPADRSGFPSVLERAVSANLLSRRDAYRLRAYHKCRNRVQHRSGKVRNETVQRMLACVINLVNEN